MDTSTADAEDRLAVTTEDASVAEASKVPAASVAAMSAGRSGKGRGGRRNSRSMASPGRWSVC